MLPEAGALWPETVEDGVHREGKWRRGHLGSAVSAVRCHHLVASIPAGAQRGKLGLPACLVVTCPPLRELLVPSGATRGAADTDMRRPCGGMLIRVHPRLLIVCTPHRWGAV